MNWRPLCIATLAALSAAGTAAAGAFALDHLNRRLPGIPPATFSIVDARDVAEIMLAAAVSGRRGERYLAAGRHMTAKDVMKAYERVTGIPAPRTRLPATLLWAVACLQEFRARTSGKPALLGLATVRTMRQEVGRTHYDHTKTETELGQRFRQIESTIRDEIAWFRDRDHL